MVAEGLEVANTCSTAESAAVGLFALAGCCCQHRQGYSTHADAVAFSPANMAWSGGRGFLESIAYCTLTGPGLVALATICGCVSAHRRAGCRRFKVATLLHTPCSDGWSHSVACGTALQLLCWSKGGMLESTVVLFMPTLCFGSETACAGLFSAGLFSGAGSGTV